ncbi:MTH865 family protein [Methanocella sp. MCL-LM]|uniref:MTH865 family protein n=1 Tax=Methanocella sp. MCL-LM TaxID=3412035 RepID=UPI003C793032
MVEDPSILGAPSGTPENIREMDTMKANIVDQLIACGVKFPIENKKQLMDIYPYGTPIKCRYQGKETSIHDLIPRIDDSIFPIKTPGDAAAALLSQCETGQR